MRVRGSLRPAPSPCCQRAGRRKARNRPVCRQGTAEVWTDRVSAGGPGTWLAGAAGEQRAAGPMEWVRAAVEAKMCRGIDIPPWGAWPEPLSHGWRPLPRLLGYWAGFDPLPGFTARTRALANPFWSWAGGRKGKLSGLSRPLWLVPLVLLAIARLSMWDFTT